MKCVVTIAVPVYGVEKYIERCARSLFEQTCDEIEYLFIDDCSPDNSIAILKSLLEYYPSRKGHVRIIRHDKNRGLGAARNTAVDNCRTKFIIHVDSDDYVAPTMVEKVLYKQKQCEADIVSFNYFEVYRNGMLVKNISRIPPNQKEWKLDIIRRRYKSVVWSLLIRTSLYKENSIRVLDGVDMGEDYQVTPRLFYYANKIVSIDDALYFYVKNCNSYTASFNRKKTDQVLCGISLLKDFFYGKGEDFYESILCGEAMTYSMYMIGCAKASDFDYSELLKSKMQKISFDIIKKLPFSYRVPYYLKDYFILLHVYATLGHCFRKCILKIKNN